MPPAHDLAEVLRKFHFCAMLRHDDRIIPKQFEPLQLQNEFLVHPCQLIRWIEKHQIEAQTARRQLIQRTPGLVFVDLLLVVQSQFVDVVANHGNGLMILIDKNGLADAARQGFDA